MTRSFYQQRGLQESTLLVFISCLQSFALPGALAGPSCGCLPMSSPSIVDFLHPTPKSAWRSSRQMAFASTNLVVPAHQLQYATSCPTVNQISHPTTRQRSKGFSVFQIRQSAAPPVNMAQTPPLTDGKGEESQDPKWTELASWALQSGISWQKWVVSEVGGGLRGAVATANLGEEEVIVSAPPEATLMVKASDPCPFPSSFLDAEFWDEAEGFWNLRMALKLIYEQRKGAESTFAPYIKVLPKAFTTPLCFSDDEVQELQWGPFIEDVNIEREYFAYEWKRLRNAMPDPPTKEDLFWGLSCAGTRTFTADYGGDQENGELMCPIADMVNHDHRAKPAFRWNPDSGEFELFAPLPFRRGEQVCISYGDVNNEHLLHYYGFIPGVNGFDHFTVSEKDLFVALPQEEQTDQPLMEARMEVLRFLMQGGAPFLNAPLKQLAPTSVVFDGEGSEVRIFPDKDGSNMVLLYARALTLSSADMERSTQAAAKKVQGGRRLYPESERRARDLISRVLRDQQASMPTSIEEDRKLLEAAEGGKATFQGNMDHYTLALRYRLGRKEMVATVLDRLRM